MKAPLSVPEVVEVHPHGGEKLQFLFWRKGASDSVHPPGRGGGSALGAVVVAAPL